MPRAQGVALYAHTPALDVVRGERPVVRTPSGDVRPLRRVVLQRAGGVLPAATAARIAPIASTIIATEPLGRRARRRADRAARSRVRQHFFLDYFRLSADHRMLFGGRANWPARRPPRSPKRSGAAWSACSRSSATCASTMRGAASSTSRATRAPDFGALDPNFFYVQGFSGHGVALTGIAGRGRRAIAGDTRAFDLFRARASPALPGGDAARQPALELGMLYHRVRGYSEPNSSVILTGRRHSPTSRVASLRGDRQRPTATRRSPARSMPTCA